ncbi:hypothetical protein H8N03_00960 [Ramlibacter sp. USB13]|uniref:Uncharacterized protein n=1 Tax=Ramlibacter cellulosilyticus TaxID=2764187 RepID=A0A923MMI2_9BURK|nr:hypothetical protein [Ramlibacter cellulosilyticus]MBC5781491.1 hypothetical protein [Ramlibacter cellulosilyticus]
MTRVFIHSWHGDFAKTAFAEEPDSAKRAAGDGYRRLKLIACGCGTRHLQRIRRPLWMRPVFLFRLYRCGRCGADVFRPRGGQRKYYAAF